MARYVLRLTSSSLFPTGSSGQAFKRERKNGGTNGTEIHKAVTCCSQFSAQQ